MSSSNKFGLLLHYLFAVDHEYAATPKLLHNQNYCIPLFYKDIIIFSTSISNRIFFYFPVIKINIYGDVS